MKLQTSPKEFRVWSHLSNRWITKDISGPILQYENDLLVFNANDSKRVLVQYTGLKDREREKIFEGDVVEWRSNMYYVEFCEGSFRLEPKYKNLFSGIELSELCEYDDEYDELPIAEVDIIGNIFENPELLEGK